MYLGMIHQVQQRQAQQQAAEAQQQQQQADAGRQQTSPQTDPAWWHQPGAADASSSASANSRADQRTPVSEQTPSDPGLVATSDSNMASTSQAAADVKQRNSSNGPPSADALAANSAHSLYNSYGYNPWSSYASHGQFGQAGGGKGAIDTKEGILEKELHHLKAALGEKGKEVERLTSELEKSFQLIEQLKQHNMALTNSLSLITTQAHSSHGSHAASQQNNGGGGDMKSGWV